MKVFKKTVMTAAAILCCVSLSGCVGKEPNEIAYIVALGIDKGENDNFDVTIQYANTTQISGGSSEEGGKNGSQIVENIMVEAPTVYGAVSVANRIVSKTFSLSHAKLIVFSEEVARDGLHDIVETFIRSEELRPDVNLAVAPDGANDYLESINPVMEVNPAKYYQMIYNKNAVAGLTEGMAEKFFFSIETGDYDCLLPLAGVIGGSEEKSGGESDAKGGSEGDSGGSEGGSEGSEEGSETGGKEETRNEKQKNAPLNLGEFEYRIKDYVGGEASIKQKNKSESIGSAIFDKDKMIGTLGSVETELFRLLIDDYKYSYLTLYNKDTPNSPVTIKTTQERKTKYDIDRENKVINVELFIEGDVYSLPSDYHIEDNIVDFEKNSREYIENAARTFIKGFIDEYDSDILRLKERSKIGFLTNKEYYEFRDNVDFREYDVNVKVDFEIRRTGLIVRESNGKQEKQ